MIGQFFAKLKLHKASQRTVMASRWELTDEQWKLVELILHPARRKNNRGRAWYETRAVLNDDVRCRLASPTIWTKQVWLSHQF
jgi:hypothetical protein